MEPYPIEQVLISALVGWGLVLGPAAIVRFGLVRKPLRKEWAVFFCVVAWIAWMAFGAVSGEPINQGALFVLLLATYFLLRAGAGKLDTNTDPLAIEATKASAKAKTGSEPLSDSGIAFHPEDSPEALAEVGSPVEPAISEQKSNDSSKLKYPTSTQLGVAGKQRFDRAVLTKGFFLVVGVLAVSILLSFALGIHETDESVVSGTPPSTEHHESSQHNWWNELPGADRPIDWWNDSGSAVVSAISEWARVGNVAAQHNLAFRLSQGHGTIRDPYQSYCWYSHAAGKGHPAAMNNLGLMYWQGQTVEANKVKAHALFNVAASLVGSESAVSNRDKIERELSADELRVAVSLARHWDDSGFKWASQRHFRVLIDQQEGDSLLPGPEKERAYSCDQI